MKIYNNDLDNLYSILFYAKKNKDTRLIKSTQAKIRKKILEEKRSEFETDSCRDFFSAVEGKVFLKNLIKFLNGKSKFDEVQIAKIISSMLTHSLIEMQRKGPQIFSELRILDQASSLNSFLCGDINADKVKEIYKTAFGQYL